MDRGSGMIFGRHINFLIICLVASIPVFSFQNCQQMNFVGIGSIESLGSSAIPVTKNGEPYGGMTPGLYYHFIPNFACEGNSAPVSSLSIVGNQVTLTENKALKCGSSVTPLNSNLIDWSIYQNEIVGYREGIYQGLSSAPAAIPANLVEVWCRDANTTSGIETIMHFNNQTKAAVNRIYYGDSFLPDFSVTRTLTRSEIVVSSPGLLSLHIHRNQPAPQLGLFMADIRVKINGANFDRITYCRLGGSLDPSVWPVKKITDLNSASDFKVSPDFNRLAYATTEIEASFILENIEGDQSKRLGGPMNSLLSARTAGFQFSPDGNSLLFTSDFQSANYLGLFSQGIGDGGSMAPLSVNNSSFNSDGIANDFQVTQDGKFVLFREPGANDLFHKGLNLYNLFSKATDSSIKTLLNPLVAPALYPDSPLLSVSNFHLVKNANKVVYLCCQYLSVGSYTGDLYSSDLLGQNILNISPILPKDFTLNPIFADAGSDSVLVMASNSSNNLLLPIWFVVKLDGSGSFQLPPSNKVLINNNALAAVLVQGPESPTKLVNLNSGAQFNIPSPYSFPRGGMPGSYNQQQFFTKDGSYFTALNVLNIEAIQPFSVNTSSGQVSLLCSDQLTSKANLIERNGNQILIVTYDLKSHLLKVWQSAVGGQCRLLNSAMSDDMTVDSIEDLVLSPDQNILMVRLGQDVANGIGGVNEQNSLLLYIPLNGQVPIRIDSPVYKGSLIYRAQFLKDANSILFWGSQIKLNENNIYRWSATQ